MTALVQAANASKNPILLRYDAKGGHSGIGSVNKTIEQQVDQLAFIASRSRRYPIGMPPLTLRVQGDRHVNTVTFSVGTPLPNGRGSDRSRNRGGERLHWIR